MPKSGRRREWGRLRGSPYQPGLRDNVRRPRLPRRHALAPNRAIRRAAATMQSGGHHAAGDYHAAGAPVRGRAAITRFRATPTRPGAAITRPERPPGRRTAATRFGRPASGSDSRDPGQESGRLHAALLGQLIPDRGGAFLAGKYRPSIRKTSHLIGGSSENAPAVGDGAASSGQLSEGKRPRIDDRHGVRHPCVENRRSCHLAEPPLATGPQSSCRRYMHSSLVRDEKSLDVCHGHAHFLQLRVALVRGFSSAATGA
jgi:hypothetical protein